jgi:hypothetical protein
MRVREPGLFTHPPRWMRQSKYCYCEHPVRRFFQGAFDVFRGVGGTQPITQAMNEVVR